MKTLLHIQYDEGGIALAISPALKEDPVNVGLVLTQALVDAAFESPAISAAVRTACHFLEKDYAGAKKTVEEARVGAVTINTNANKS